MSHLTPLEKQFKNFEAELVRKQQFQPAKGFDDKQASPAQREKRIKKALDDFWYFDKTYFPPEAHRQNYSEPGILHQTMLKATEKAGIHWFAAHRELAKSAYLVKIRLWQFLNGKAVIGGILCEDLRKARFIVKTYEFVLKDNPRIKEDFEVKIIESNNEFLSFTSKKNQRMCVMMPFSLERSPRGSLITLDRPDFIDFDDLETLGSSFDKEAVEKRIDKVVEAFKSADEKASCISLSNNLHKRCAFNTLRTLKEKGAPKAFFNLYPFPDWSKKKTIEIPYKGSVWKQRFPAKSEQEMKVLRRITDEHEWAQAQCAPKLREGSIFPPQHWQEWEKLPADAKGVVYCDQNNAKHGAGDTTAMGGLLYSQSLNQFFVYKPRCRSYNDPNKLLDDFFDIFSIQKTIGFAMDGAVNQESNWEAFLRNWRLSRGKNPPYTQFKRYKVDDFISMAQSIYKADQVFFPKDFHKTEDGERFQEQFFGFEGKKANKKDDAPDWFISAYMFGLDEGRFTPASGSLSQDYAVTGYKQKFQF